jgi:hypothetical protein
MVMETKGGSKAAFCFIRVDDEVSMRLRDMKNHIEA